MKNTMKENLYIVECGSLRLAVMSYLPTTAIERFWKHYGLPKGERQQQQTVITEVVLAIDII